MQQVQWPCYALPAHLGSVRTEKLPGAFWPRKEIRCRHLCVAAGRRATRPELDRISSKRSVSKSCSTRGPPYCRMNDGTQNLRACHPDRKYLSPAKILFCSSFFDAEKSHLIWLSDKAQTLYPLFLKSKFPLSFPFNYMLKRFSKSELIGIKTADVGAHYTIEYFVELCRLNI